MNEKCGFFLWGTDAERSELERFGETLASRAARTKPQVSVAIVSPAREVAPIPPPVPPPAPVPASVVPAPRSLKHPIYEKRGMYPKLSTIPDDDDFDYFQDTPTKPRPGSERRRRPQDEEEEPYWEYSDEDLYSAHPTGPKRPRFETQYMEDVELSSPPISPEAQRRVSPPRKPITLQDPFTTPTKQITHTPNTPPDTRHVKSPGSTLPSVSQSLIKQLQPFAGQLGDSLWSDLKDHLVRCGRVADGAIKGRDSARSSALKKDARIEELEKDIRILKAEREVDKAIIAALQRNVDVLTGKVKPSD